MRQEPKVIALRDRVVFVIVAFRALEREREQIVRDHFGGPLQHAVANVERVEFVFVGVVGGVAEKRGGGEKFDDLRREFFGVAPIDHFVTGELLVNEAVERFVLIQRTNHVIAIAPLPVAEFDRSGVVVAPQHIDVAGPIQPVPAPAFAEVRRSEQTINQLVLSFGRIVRQELRDLFRCRRKSEEVKRRAAAEGASIGR